MQKRPVCEAKRADERDELCDESGFLVRVELPERFAAVRRCGHVISSCGGAPAAPGVETIIAKYS
jgi:hypothetical protein